MEALSVAADFNWKCQHTWQPGCKEYDVVPGWLFDRRFRDDSFFSIHRNSLARNSHHGACGGQWSSYFDRTGDGDSFTADGAGQCLSHGLWYVTDLVDLDGSRDEHRGRSGNRWRGNHLVGGPTDAARGLFDTTALQLLAFEGLE